jgi:hypothetical protein
MDKSCAHEEVDRAKSSQRIPDHYGSDQPHDQAVEALHWCD